MALPDRVPRVANRLKDELSPYLRQHAHNPVDWFAWGADAHARAKAEHKPILLSIGYSACHWCHVMAHECFENPDIAALMNEHFVNIKVDREERPDLDDLYQKAVQAFTGRGGGWPLTVFLTPDQEPFYGGTYFPPVPRYNLPGFPQVLLGVVEAYRQHPDEVRQNVDRVKVGLRGVSSPPRSDDPLTVQLLEDGVRDLGLLFEPVHGGFGDGPKFPTVQPFNLLLRHHARTGDAGSLEKVLLSLRHIAAGGIYDHLGGGFHRYSVDAKWLVPHFEKMLYDQAQLARLFLDGWRLTGEARFKQVVEETLGYIRREMTSPDGVFYTAQDADSEGEEGKYFVWTPVEVDQVLGKDLGRLFSTVYGVTEEGNFEGKSILNRLAGGRLEAKELEEIDRILAPARQRLLEVRERRMKPGLDNKILTGWNGLMVSGLLDAYQTFGDPAWLTMAETALAVLLDQACRDGRVSRTITNGQGRLSGCLDDYALLGAALLDAYEATANPTYLYRASDVTEVLLDRFWDEESGGFFMTGRDHEPLLQRMKPGTDSAMPSGNSVAVMNLLRLSVCRGEQRYRDRAEQTLRVFRTVMDQHAYGSAGFLCALDRYLAKPKEIVLVGSRIDPRLQDLLRRLHGRYVPNKTLAVVDPQAGHLGRVPEAARGKGMIDGRPTAYVCQDCTCSAPVTKWSQLEGLL